MARQYIVPGFPFPFYVNETNGKQFIVPGAYVNATSGGGGGGSAALTSLLAFSTRMVSAIAGAIGLAGKVTDTSTVKAATTNTTSIAGNITDVSKVQAVTTNIAGISGKIVDAFKLQALAAYPAGIAGILKYMSAAKLDKIFPSASFVTTLSSKVTAQCKTKISGAFAVGIAAKTAFISEGRGVIVFISALFATVTMQSTARAIANRASGLQGLLRFDTRTKITGGSFPVGIAAKVAFISKGVGTVGFLVSLFASTMMRSALKGATSSATALQGVVKASSRFKLFGGVFTAGMQAKTAFTTALRALIATSGNVVLTVYNSSYVARSPFGMYCARAVDKYIVHSPIGRYVGRGGRAK